MEKNPKNGYTAYWYLLTAAMVLSIPTSIAQTVKASFDKLSFQVEEQWSKRIEKDRVVYDNYNLKTEPRASIVLYRFVAAADEKTFFQQQWSAIWPDSVAAPRPRRFYTENSQLFWSGGAAISTTDGTGYGQLYVFTTPTGYQSMMVWLPDGNAFKKTQTTWNLMAQTAVLK